MTQLDPRTLPPLWWCPTHRRPNFHRLAYIPSNTTPTRLTAIASAAAGDPTPFEGTFYARLELCRAWVIEGPGAFDATRAPYIAFAEALERFIEEPKGQSLEEVS